MIGYNVTQEFDEVHNGLRIVGLFLDAPYCLHRCGYVGVTKDSPLFGKSYSDDKFPYEVFKQSLDRPIGDLSPILVFCAAGEDFDKEGISLEYICDVHGGITYSSDSLSATDQTEETWWFGFDCAHLDDTPEKCTTEFVKENCKKLADQLVEISKILKKEG